MDLERYHITNTIITIITILLFTITIIITILPCYI